MYCRKCGGEFTEIFFRRDPSHACDGRRLVCKGCEQESRDEIKLKNRPKHKVSDALRRHAAKYDMLPTDFSKKFGWKIDSMEHDLNHTYSNGCQYCRRSFKSMGHGYADITIDIHDRERAPFYGANTRWICLTCNREKGTMSPEQWASLLLEWEKWEDHQEKLKSDQCHGLPMASYWSGISAQV